MRSGGGKSFMYLKDQVELEKDREEKSLGHIRSLSFMLNVMKM